MKILTKLLQSGCRKSDSKAVVHLRLRFFLELLHLNRVSDSVMETLSIIAYKQPVTKMEIEKIRGVSSDHAVSKLVEYNLVCELGRLDAPGRPLLFGTTEEFLRSFGVHSVDELPVLSPVQLEEFKQEAEEEMNVQLDI